MLIYHLGDEQKAPCGGSSETPYHPINMIIIIIVINCFQS
jgi:hypothetical protein